MQRAIKLCPKSTIPNVSPHIVKAESASFGYFWRPQQLYLPSENVTEDREMKNIIKLTLLPMYKLN